ncbi:flagellar basal body rod protein FlgB [Pseudoxanthomonas daejeonensis]|jgi:flagellar basal-body rod protein FlgB|uniref:Flagellar basal body rod protein FlgB n=1 Tax=Pseudoxanthomonas daejeonensis TaxID=266062 RepID=A0ABQ6Z6L8_9GAMM|nr:flagellar basal body rod protein FlgB [Pseudoxanthomonas daejeonensis]KAF1694036.1 flagellar basal body rod protein FlgB [Pseudoxanthomonas daejeonensis]UNK57305.1 flagellar basal body rod protein FlgB [Pseudoxanthomonas daejeonensis]
MSNPISSYMGVHADALPLREQRMKLIASNLANADTPGYKAQDMDFNAALGAARMQREGLAPATGLATTREGHLSDAIATGQLPFQLTRQSSQPSLDGNTVDPDAERAAYGRAALEYRASLSFLESKVRTLLTAITGQ